MIKCLWSLELEEGSYDEDDWDSQDDEDSKDDEDSNDGDVAISADDSM